MKTNFPQLILALLFPQQHDAPKAIDVSKPSDKTFESEKWKLIHENLDLKHDLDALVAFINTAKRTGKWNVKQLQLKSLSLDRINNEKSSISIPLHKEIQSRDERIQILQAENEYLKKIQMDLSKQVFGKRVRFFFHTDFLSCLGREITFLVSRRWLQRKSKYD